MPRSPRAARTPAERMREVVERWYLAEPALVAAWTTHHLAAEPRLATIRTGRGRIEYNPQFIASLDRATLRAVMAHEAVRILLKHPYERRKSDPQRAWMASNIAIHECYPTPLPIPPARELFGPAHERKFFEHYYRLLSAEPNAGPGGDAGDGAGGEGGDGSQDGEGGEGGEGADAPDEANESDGKSPGRPAGTAEKYIDDCARENTAPWEQDLLMHDTLDNVIRDIMASDSWGGMPGSARELIVASLRPRMDYRRVLRAFRASVLSMRRRLTRMKPSRRYGFLYMGSRREFSTRLLFAMDVSGSVGSEALRTGLAVVNRFFKYGIEAIEVIQFDTRIRGPATTLKRARQSIEAGGRGGTDFQPVIDYLDANPGYDGLIIFTDGIAPLPERPKASRQTRIVWLFQNERQWAAMHRQLAGRGMSSAFIE